MVFRRLPWQVASALFAMLTGADIIASNQSTAFSSFTGTIQLQSSSSGANLSELVPLTRDAMMRNNSPLEGNLFDTDPDSVQKISTEDIAYISCNTLDYPGNMDAMDVLTTALNEHNLTAVILYSTASDFCGYDGATEPLQEFPMFSMTNREDSQNILDDVNNIAVSAKFFVTVSRVGSDSQESGNQQQPNPLGPSPSTAVAMIILYSITGIITALFLVIIITGAVRAHRHPDRYGPRDVLGRPRQSRARGLGRAILDTLPIVKFGERETPKPTDVEMGSTAEARNVNGPNGETGAQNDQTGSETRTAEQTETQRGTLAEQQSGIAPAQPLPAGVAAPQEHSSAEEGLGCSICTDDFEKGQDLRVLPCNHKFHPECVDPWLLNVSGTCPLCRVDLRPTTSRSSAEEDDVDELAPPLQPEVDTSHRRRSALRDILSLRSRPDASAEERISALRRLREQRHNQSGDVASGSANASAEDVAAARRSRRISARFSGVFSSRTRRHGHDDAPGPSAEIGTAHPATITGPTPTSTSDRVSDMEESQRRS